MRSRTIRSAARGVVVSAAALAFAFGASVAGAAPGENGKGADNAAANSAAADKPDNDKAPKAPKAKSKAKASGDTNSPQPPSNADFSGNGANKHGPYDSTRDGSPSKNGNGDGKAAGKPCAGCVGKADNKNPPGQMPDGSDPNSGYECDTNKGVGKSNPAHTGCVETPEKPPTTTTPPSTSTTPPTTAPGMKPTTSPGKKTTVGVVPGAIVPGGGESSGGGGGLSLTGVDIVSPIAAGLALLAAGGVFLTVARRRAGKHS